jgi:hypothetical protein
VSAPPPARPPALTVAAARLLTWEGDTRADYEAALKRLDALGATRTGAQGPLWRVTCDKLVRRSAGGAGKAAELFLVTTTARKGKTWVMFGSRVLELGAAAPRLLALLRAEPTKAQARIEGQEFAVGDLRVRLGTVFVGGRAQRLAIEVEYAPCAHCGDATRLLQEIMQSVAPASAATGGALRLPELPLAEFGLGERFSGSHAALEYALTLLPTDRA